MREASRAGVRSFETEVPRRDGVVLRADVHLPAAGGAHPTLVMRLPYDKSSAQSYWYAPPQWYAAHGYAVVVEDVRGRFASDGVFAPIVHEGADGEDLIRWVLEQPWCDGALGMYGYSYAGYLQLLTCSTEIAPQIRAISPALAFSSLRDGCLRSGGATAAGFLLSWAEQLGGLTLPGSDLRELTSHPLASYMPCVAPEHRDWAAAWLRDDDADAYWKAIPRPEYARVRAAVLVTGGWYDTFRRDAFGHHDALVRTGRDSRLMIGPWSHNPFVSAALGEPLGPRARSWDIDAAQLALFDSALRGEGDPPSGAHLAIMNSDDAWEADAWPPRERRRLELWLDSPSSLRQGGDGKLSAEPPARPGADALHSDPAHPVPSRGGDDCGDPVRQGMGPALQHAVEMRPDVLVYTTAPADRELTLVGEASVELHTECEGPVEQWVARLAIVLDEDRSINLVEGVVRLPGSRDEHLLRIEIGEFAVRLDRGQRLRLHLAQTSTPRWGPLPVPTTARVLRGPASPSRLILHVAA